MKKFVFCLLVVTLLSGCSSNAKSTSNELEQDTNTAITLSAVKTSQPPTVEDVINAETNNSSTSELSNLSESQNETPKPQKSLEQIKAEKLSNFTDSQKNLLQQCNSGWTFSTVEKAERDYYIVFYYMGERIRDYALADLGLIVDMGFNTYYVTPLQNSIVFMNDKAYLYNGIGTLLEIDVFNDKITELFSAEIFSEYGIYEDGSFVKRQNPIVVCGNHMYTYAIAKDWYNLLEINADSQTFSFIGKMDSDTARLIFLNGTNYSFDNSKVMGYIIEDSLINTKIKMYDYDFSSNQLTYTQEIDITDIAEDMYVHYYNFVPQTEKFYMCRRSKEADEKTGFDIEYYQISEYDVITKENRDVAQIRGLDKYAELDVTMVIDNWVFVRNVFAENDGIRELYRCYIKDGIVNVLNAEKVPIVHDSLKFDIWNVYTNWGIIPYSENGTPLSEYLKK